MYITNVTNLSIDDVDLSYSGASRDGRALYISNGDVNGPTTITDCNFQNRDAGAIILGGQDVTVTGNDFRHTGSSEGNPALQLQNIIENTLTGGLDVSGNSFGGAGADCGIVFSELRDLHLSSAAGGTVNVVLPAMSSVVDVNSTNPVLYFVDNRDVIIEDLDLSNASQFGTAIEIVNSNAHSNTRIENNNLSGRITGIRITGGRDYTILGNDLSSSGSSTF